MGRLSGKVALITGGGQGIGLAVARVYAREGANLTITGRDEAKLKHAAPELEKLGAKVLVCAGDAGQRASAEEAVKATVEAFGRLDVLVNNAQTTSPVGPIEDLAEEWIRKVVDSGFYGALWHMLAALPHLKASKGSIINMGSAAGILGVAHVAIYGAQKEAVRGLSRSLAREWGPHGIRINTLNPLALTAVQLDYYKANPDIEKAQREEVPLRRIGDPETDIGPTALFLATDDSRYVTGQTLNVDGGMVML